MSLNIFQFLVFDTEKQNVSCNLRTPFLDICYIRNVFQCIGNSLVKFIRPTSISWYYLKTSRMSTFPDGSQKKLRISVRRNIVLLQLTAYKNIHLLTVQESNRTLHDQQSIFHIRLLTSGAKIILILLVLIQATLPVFPAEYLRTTFYRSFDL
jgi:hypothetical protein